MMIQTVVPVPANGTEIVSPVVMPPPPPVVPPVVPTSMGMMQQKKKQRQAPPPPAHDVSCFGSEDGVHGFKSQSQQSVLLDFFSSFLFFLRHVHSLSLCLMGFYKIFAI